MVIIVERAFGAAIVTYFGPVNTYSQMCPMPEIPETINRLIFFAGQDNDAAHTYDTVCNLM